VSEPDCSLEGEVFKLMTSCLEDVTVELFSAYDLPVAPVGREFAPHIATSERSSVAIIGFGGNGVRGALLLFATNASIERWMAAFGAGPGEESDTLGEFSNMLLGRLKGRLLSENLTLLLSTPTTTSGNALQLSSPQGQSSSQVFAGADWSVMTRLDASFDSGFTLEASHAPVEGVAEAGDAMLF